MKHYIYSVHACGGSRWSKGYTEFYMTDEIIPTATNPVMSVVVLQIGETEEIITPRFESSIPSNEVTVRIIRATYNKAPYGMKEQMGYIFQLTKYDINILIGMCQDNIDAFLEGKDALDINESKFVNWNYQVSKG